MAIEIKTWQIINGKLTQLSSSMSNENRKEKNDLEQWLKYNPEILGNDIAIIGEQVATKSGPMDFLGIDRSGNTVIVELKRDMLPREALVQAIDYASDVAEWDINKFREICKTFNGQALEDHLLEKFEGISIEDLTVNQTQRLLLVGFAVEEALSRMIEWLSNNYNLGINAIVLSYIKTQSQDELLSRMVIIPEEIEKQKVNKKKFVIAMSNEPGTYDQETLKQQLTKYLSNELVSSQRIRDYFLPILIEKGKITREELKKEFLKRNAAPTDFLAGNSLSLISSQLGYKWNDFLRQIISYEFPNHVWEKDNFQIKDEYKSVVQQVLAEFSGNQ